MNMAKETKPERFTNATGTPVPDNTNILTAGRRGPALLQDIWLIEKLAHFDREVIPERKRKRAPAGDALRRPDHQRSGRSVFDRISGGCHRPGKRPHGVRLRT